MSVYTMLPDVDDTRLDYLELLDRQIGADGRSVTTRFRSHGYGQSGASAPPLGPSWEPPRTALRRGTVRNDYPCIGGLIVAFSPEAHAVLSPLLDGNGEFLPTECDRDGYVAFLPAMRDGLLDHDRSTVTWEKFPPSAKRPFKVARQVARYVLAPEADGIGIFRLPEDPPTVLVNGAFVAAVADAKLAGFVFEQVSPPPRPATGSFADMERRAGLGGR